VTIVEVLLNVFCRLLKIEREFFDESIATINIFRSVLLIIFRNQNRLDLDKIEIEENLERFCHK
jgi:hypothetical protein